MNIMILLKEKREIKNWLRSYNIRNYRLIKDKEHSWIVDVFENIDLSNKSLKEIPLKFNKVEGQFLCNNNELTELDFAPIMAHSFYCQKNNLKSLKGCPQKLKGSVNCSYNDLTSLEHAPLMIRDSFFCSHNHLDSLKYGPIIVKGFYVANQNKLQTLEYCPRQAVHMDLLDNPLLGEFQFIRQFNKIYAQHLRVMKMIDFKETMEESLQIKLNSKVIKI